MEGSSPKYEQPQSLLEEYQKAYPDNPALAEHEAYREHVRRKREARGWRTEGKDGQ